MSRNNNCKMLTVIGYAPTTTRDSWGYEVPGFRIYGTTFDDNVHGTKATSFCIDTDEMFSMVQHPDDLIGRVLGRTRRINHHRKVFLAS